VLKTDMRAYFSTNSTTSRYRPSTGPTVLIRIALARIQTSTGKTILKRRQYINQYASGGSSLVCRLEKFGPKWVARFENANSPPLKKKIPKIPVR